MFLRWKRVKMSDKWIGHVLAKPIFFFPYIWKDGKTDVKVEIVMYICIIHQQQKLHIIGIAIPIWDLESFCKRYHNKKSFWNALGIQKTFGKGRLSRNLIFLARILTSTLKANKIRFFFFKHFYPFILSFVLINECSLQGRLRWPTLPLRVWRGI